MSAKTTAPTVAAPKLCVDCAHYRPATRIAHAQCVRPRGGGTSLVDGSPLIGGKPCSIERGAPANRPDFCGAEAQFFEPRPPGLVPFIEEREPPRLSWFANNNLWLMPLAIGLAFIAGVVWIVWRVESAQ